MLTAAAQGGGPRILARAPRRFQPDLSMIRPASAVDFLRRQRALVPLLLSLAAGPLAAQSGRVIVLGFDGADARTVEQMMDRGELPNLARLRDQGTFAPLGTTNPAESPVAWAALNSGQNPAKTGIPGFVMRRYTEGGTPFATKGFSEDGVEVALGELEGAPIPVWSPAAFAAAIAAAAFLVFLVVFGGLLRLDRRPTLVLSLALAAIGAWGGWTMRSYLPATFPVTKNPLKAAPFWEVAAAAGVPTRVLDGQQAWDREPVEGAKVLCGLGVPDARGGYVSYFVYTTDELHFARDVTESSAGTGSGGVKLRVDEVDGVIETHVYGPDNFWRQPSLQAEIDGIDERLERGDLQFRKQSELEERKRELETLRDTPVAVAMRIEILKEPGLARVTIGTQTQELRPGEWSRDWYRLTFELNPLLKVHAATRVKLVSLDDPYFELFVNTIEIDPASPPFWQPISQPASFAPELAGACGTFETAGWSCLTHPLKDEVIGPDTFLEDIEFTTAWRERLLADALERDDWRLLVSVFAETDRLQHMMYQYYDPGHPLHDPAEAAQKLRFYGEEIALSEAIPAVYRKVDQVVGRVLERLREDDLLILCADHGFQSFRRQVQLNNWLAKEGYLAVRANPAGSGAPDLYVDWPKTRAYAMGLGTIYVNVKDGASSVGTVEPQEREALAREIAAKLLEATDPDTGERICSSADLSAEIHSGPYHELEADLLVGFAANYRIAWSTTGGGIAMSGGAPGPFVYDNDKTWSGDHVSVDPRLVRGIFFCNRKLDLPEGGVDLLHVAPTALAALGVAVPSELDVAPLALE
jgi:predicted AlkP superfamily phosphohydrolase/phosphomutase